MPRRKSLVHVSRGATHIRVVRILVNAISERTKGWLVPRGIFDCGILSVAPKEYTFASNIGRCINTGWSIMRTCTFSSSFSFSTLRRLSCNRGSFLLVARRER